MQKQQGFTLIEVLITMAILGIIAAMAYPSFRTSINKSQVSSTSNEVYGLLRFARAQALQTGGTIVVKGLDNNGDPSNLGAANNKGLVAWVENSSPTNEALESVDTELRRIRYEGDLKFTLDPVSNVIVFRGDGFLLKPDEELEIKISIDNADVQSNIITILPSGIVALNKEGS